MSHSTIADRPHNPTFTAYVMIAPHTQEGFMILKRALFLAGEYVPDDNDFVIKRRYLWTCRGRFYRNGGKYLKKGADAR